MADVLMRSITPEMQGVSAKLALELPSFARFAHKGNSGGLSVEQRQGAGLLRNT